MHNTSVVYKDQDIKLILIRSLYVKSECGFEKKGANGIFFIFDLSKLF